MTDLIIDALTLKAADAVLVPPNVAQGAAPAAAAAAAPG